MKGTITYIGLILSGLSYVPHLQATPSEKMSPIESHVVNLATTPSSQEKDPSHLLEQLTSKNRCVPQESDCGPTQ